MKTAIVLDSIRPAQNQRWRIVFDNWRVCLPLVQNALAALLDDQCLTAQTSCIIVCSNAKFRYLFERVRLSRLMGRRFSRCGRQGGRFWGSEQDGVGGRRVEP